MTSQAEKIRESFKNHKWEPSRHFMDFHIAGFAYYDGLDVIDQLILGQQVSLIVEADNPHDPEAVAIYFKDIKLGYVPSAKNILLSNLLYYGHSAIFEFAFNLSIKKVILNANFVWSSKSRTIDSKLICVNSKADIGEMSVFVLK